MLGSKALLWHVNTYDPNWRGMRWPLFCNTTEPLLRWKQVPEMKQLKIEHCNAQDANCTDRSYPDSWQRGPNSFLVEPHCGIYRPLVAVTVKLKVPASKKNTNCMPFAWSILACNSTNGDECLTWDTQWAQGGIFLFLAVVHLAHGN